MRAPEAAWGSPKRQKKAISRMGYLRMLEKSLRRAHADHPTPFQILSPLPFRPKCQELSFDAIFMHFLAKLA
jgi:hypothetical protein